MTLLYIKDQKWLIFAHQKWWTIQCDPKLPCHPIALIMYSLHAMYMDQSPRNLTGQSPSCIFEGTNSSRGKKPATKEPQQKKLHG